MIQRVNYDPIAPNYHQRYETNLLAGVAASLRFETFIPLAMIAGYLDPYDHD